MLFLVPVQQPMCVSIQKQETAMIVFDSIVNCTWFYISTFHAYSPFLLKQDIKICDLKLSMYVISVVAEYF